MNLQTWAAGVGVVGFLALLIISKTQEEGRLRATIQGQAVCLAAIETTESDKSKVSCPAPVAARHLAALRADRCDAALLKADLFAVEAACSTEVKTLQAQRDAENRRADSLADALTAARADQTQAIARAEARGRSQTQRTLNAQAAVNAAPRDPDGLVRCDAECLRLRTSSRP